LHLYIPPRSAHAIGVQKSLISGGIHRILTLTSEPEDQKTAILRFYHRLVARGYNPKKLQTRFKETLFRYQQKQKEQTSLIDIIEACGNESDWYKPIFLHLTYNPHDPSRQFIQQAFRKHMLTPCNSYQKTYNTLFPESRHPFFRNPSALHRAFIVKEPPLSELENAERVRTRINRLIIAYKRAPNLKNILFPRHAEAKCPGAQSASLILTELRQSPE